MQCLFALSEAQRSRRCGEKHMSETVTGYIDHVIFRNEDNGYTVMVLKGTKKEEELTCVGSFPAITQGHLLKQPEYISIIRYMANSFRSVLLQRRCRRIHME